MADQSSAVTLPPGYTLDVKPQLPAGYTLDQTPAQPAAQPYNFPKPTYKSSLPGPFGRMDEAVQDSIDWMADGVQRMIKAETLDEKLAGLHETVSGFFNTAGAPLVLQGLGTAPVRTAIGVGLGLGTQKAAETVLPVLGAGPGTTMAGSDIAGIAAGMYGPDVLPAVGRGVVAAAPDVAKGTGKMAVGTAITQIPIPSMFKFGLGAPLALSGGRQIVRGLGKGFQEAWNPPGGPVEAAPATPEPAPYTPGGPGAPIVTPPPETPPAQGSPGEPPVAEAMTPGQAYAASQGVDWNTLRPVDRQQMENIARARVNVASQPAPAQPEAAPPPAAAAPGTPAAGLPALSVDQLARDRFGRNFSELSGDQQAQVQQEYQGLQQPAFQGLFRPGEPSAQVLYSSTVPPTAPPLTPQDLTELATGRPPSRQTEAAQQTAAETLATAQNAAPPAAEAPTGPPVDPVAWTREQLAAGNRVSAAALQQRFGLRLSAARKLLKDLASPATSAEGQAAFEQAKASGQPAITPTPEPPSELEQQLAASIREAQARKTTPAPVVQPGQTVAEALAAQAPPGPKSLAELMAGIPEQPELEKLDFAHITRTRNVERLYDTMKKAGVTPEMVDAEGDAGWAAVAKKAKIGPKGKAYVPSETTKAQLRQRFAERR